MPLPSWALSRLRSRLALWWHRALQEVLITFETVGKKAGSRLRPQLLGAAMKLRLLPFLPACAVLQPCLFQVPYPGWPTSWLTHGLDIPAWHWSCLITTDLSGNLGWIWLLTLGLICSGTLGLLLLSEWHLSLTDQPVLAAPEHLEDFLEYCSRNASAASGYTAFKIKRLGSWQSTCVVAQSPDTLYVLQQSYCMWAERKGSESAHSHAGEAGAEAISLGFLKH